MNRFPGGAAQPGFWNKQLPDHAPGWLPRWDNPDAKEGRTTTYLVVDEPAALVWVANYGALEWHAWTSLAADPGSPTYALIDIDPGAATTWEDVLVLARLHRTALAHLGVRAQPKVTGRRGIQIWIPVSPGLDLPGHAGCGWKACPRRSALLCPSWSAGSGMSASGTAWPGSTTPRT